MHHGLGSVCLGVMPFGLKNVSPIPKSKAFKDYLDDFIVFNDLHTH